MYSYKAFVLIQCVSRVGVGGVNPIILCARALLISLALVAFCQATDDARRLYDDLLKKSNYNRVVRPGPGQEFYDQLAKDPTANYTLELRLKLKLAQIIDVAEKSEIITMNTWLTQQWYDYKLQWNPKHYGNVTELNIPSESIWVPDLTLYNNADGDYVVTLMTKARVRYDGRVHWEPPAVFKSYCNINVFYFPFDEQHCHMKFSTWTYDGEMIGLTHLDWKNTQAYNATIYPGIDLMQLYPNNEWDIMNVTARKKQKYYPCCKERYYDLYFYITIRRKTLFYSYNVLIPVVSINMLTILAFYLPADCGEKISLCISILLSLSLFQLMLMDTMPPTSLTMPLLGKYILFTTVVVSLSVFSSVQVLNVHFRSAATHKMPYCTRKLFLCILPRLLFMNKPKIKEHRHGQQGDNMDWTTHQSDLANYVNPYKKKFKPIYREQSEENVAGCSSNTIQGSTFIGFNPASSIDMNSFCELCATVTMKKFPPNVIKAMDGVMFVAKHLHDDDETNRVKCEWKYVGLVVDRLLLWLFTTVCVVGALSILINAPVLYDSKVPFCEVHPEMCRKVED